MLLLAVGLYAEQPLTGKLIRKDLNVGIPINLRDFGGPNISIQLSGNTPSAIDAVIVSPERLMAVAEGPDGSTRSKRPVSVNGVQRRSRNESVRVEKKNGIRFPGSNSDMYLLYTDKATGLKVYFLDTRAMQNEWAAVIEVPPPAKK